MEQVTLVKSGSDGLQIGWSCLADKKTGTKKIFVLDFKQEESAKGMFTPAFIKIINFTKPFILYSQTLAVNFLGTGAMKCPYLNTYLEVCFQKKCVFC